MQILGGRGHYHQPKLVSENLSHGIKISAVCFFLFYHKACVSGQMDGHTDRQTDRQNYDPQHHASIAFLRVDRELREL